MKRTAESKSFGDYVFQSSASRTPVQLAGPLIAKALGYFHSVRFADVENNFTAKPSEAFTPRQVQHPLELGLF